MIYRSICIDNTDIDLSLYKNYLVENINHKFLKVYDDYYYIPIGIFYKNKFKTNKEIRQNKLNKLEI